MARLSLSARLAVTFVVITVTCFSAVGFLLFEAAARRIHEQDDTNLVLATRHLRRLVAELDSPPDVAAHKDRLIISVLGDTNNALRIEDDAGHVLVERNSSQVTLAATSVVPVARRIVASDVQSWRDADDHEVRGVSAIGRPGDGSSVTIVVARSLADRAVLLSRYRRDTIAALAAGMLVAVLLSYVLVRRALRPLHAMADSAAAVTAHHLSTRMPAGDVPAELEALGGALNAMLARIEDGFTRVWQFTVDLAHDLRTPIGNLRGANEVALTRPRSVAEYQALLGSNIEECDRVSRTIESVLFLARADSPQFALQRVVIHAGEELQRIADYFEGLSSEAGVAVQVTADASIYADRELFRRAVSNLLSNALRYTPTGDAIHLRAQKTNRGVDVSVENPGAGIPPEHMEHLFDRFYRVDRSRSDSAHSTGLGLSIVKSIMELHGGDVMAHSELQGVTRFTLLFPDSAVSD